MDAENKKFRVRIYYKRTVDEGTDLEFDSEEEFNKFDNEQLAKMANEKEYGTFGNDAEVEYVDCAYHYD